MTIVSLSLQPIGHQEKHFVKVTTHFPNFSDLTLRLFLRATLGLLVQKNEGGKMSFLLMDS